MDTVNSDFDMLQWMDVEVREAFLKSLRRRRYRAGQLVYAQGDEANEMYRIVTGSVRMSVSSSDGREVVFLRFGPGDCFGDASLIDNEGRPQTAEAATVVEMDVLSAEAFNRLRSTYRNFDEALLHLLSRQMRFSSSLFMDVSLNALPRRVALRILQGLEAEGEAERRTSLPLKLSLSQSEIALMVGASRQTVNRILQKMQDESIITTEYNNIIVRSLDRLRSLAEQDRVHRASPS